MNTKALASWVAGVTALAVIVVTVYYLVFDNPAPKNSLTVAQAIEQRSGTTGNHAAGSSPQSSNRNLQRLLNALGLPEGTVGSYYLSQPSTSADKRTELISTLEAAIDQRIMSVTEANAVLKAFDLGIVDTEPNHIILQESSR